MRIIVFILLVVVAASSTTLTSCSSGPATFCDTACNNDTLRYTLDHPDKPFVAIGIKNCLPDTITWSHNRLIAKRKLTFSSLTGEDVHLNKNFIRHYIKDTSYAWLIFNDCVKGQGYLVKIPFNKTDNIFRKNSAFNSLDPKFSVAENLVAYTDKGNMFIEEMSTGKKAIMTFGQQIDIDYNDMHDKVDSVNVTSEKAWAKVKIDNEWKVIEQKITLK
ncbi:MAG: hypothetical protein H7Y01_12245 [Ferruginibacter sp.]|nr:hypothetical protein [Chitinophagaceae bacterium]